jgi:hypothetical protein|tara:strand:- start:5680 stop:6048 length:369 start_codon:yes stop_codon:yes gene_type:complete
MNNNKLIYVRKIGVLADDDSRLDSMCVPAKNISEIVTAGTVVQIKLKPIANVILDEGSDGDSINIICTTAPRAVDVFNQIMKEIILGEDDLVVIYDEVDDTSTGEINSNYISSIVSLSINVA